MNIFEYPNNFYIIIGEFLVLIILMILFHQKFNK